jgi:hypothetical protein
MSLPFVLSRFEWSPAIFLLHIQNEFSVSKVASDWNRSEDLMRRSPRMRTQIGCLRYNIFCTVQCRTEVNHTRETVFLRFGRNSLQNNVSISSYRKSWVNRYEYVTLDILMQQPVETEGHSLLRTGFQLNRSSVRGRSCSGGNCRYQSIVAVTLERSLMKTFHN